MKKVSTIIASFLVVLCVGVLAPAGKKPGGGAGTLVRAKFSTDQSILTPRIRSDGNYADFGSCGAVDYVDKADTCANLATPNAVQASQSHLISGGMYWLRMVPQCCATTTDGWEAYVVSPSRWLVLDFCVPVPDSNSRPVDIDAEVAGHAATANWGSLPTPQPPPVVRGCVDNVVVRFKAPHAVNGSATSTSLELLIDEPEPSSRGVYWDALYTLHFDQAVSITRDNAAGTVTLSTSGSSDVAHLLDANGVLVGTYHMPFSVTLKAVP